jgi:hypothetical protein
MNTDPENYPVDPDPPIAPTIRGPAARHYVVGGKIERRIHGTTPETIDVPAQHRDALAIEGMIALMNKGHTPNEIHSGAALPDRSPPAEKAAPKAKQPTNLMRAIAILLVARMVKDARSRGDKVDRAHIAAAALAEVAAMTKEELAAEAKKVDTKIEMLRLSKPRG